ncbi:MAG: hypothetical protein IRD7MM_00055 [Candidatus Midichloria mitochondrii]|nr:hypothetical protein [Candidatus Midichloria mitochondrii]MDJ1288332.1 hypothetical protein [Candidatus Midichloria mitochondrii]MDJ1298822.1 hypothetical protein [Candidatus Midichloria mitochondrii]MDJ1583583.1 hypothetical protein [Candidatus Midichloria mitochondrii]
MLIIWGCILLRLQEEPVDGLIILISHSGRLYGMRSNIQIKILEMSYYNFFCSFIKDFERSAAFLRLQKKEALKKIMKVTKTE